MKNKFYITATLKSVEETTALRKEVASVLDLPTSEERQPDLAYFTSRFVSTGTNLNGAHFLPSELVKAGSTVPGKAVDIEHEEEKIIGHIYKHAFTDINGNYLDNQTLASIKVSDLNKQGLHIEIASVVYKTRFPEIVEEIQSGEWAVSMEAYYQNFDLLVGNTILTLDEAALMGFNVGKADDLVGKHAKIVKAGQVVDEGKVARVLRDICFSGVGIVKNPANPPSIIFESVASVEESIQDIILNSDILLEDNNVTYSSIESNKENSDIRSSTGICVSYYRELKLENTIKTQDSDVIKKEWCSKYDTKCPIFGEAADPQCLRFVSGDMIYVSDKGMYSVADIKEVVSNTINNLQKNKDLLDLLERVDKLLV
ncbi:hypothetical protein JZU46_00170 [bacterium]|nr:hypothetical protein [bacterium]